jgi:hypothetical protein
MGYQFILVVTMLFPNLPLGKNETTQVIPMRDQTTCNHVKRETIEDSRKYHQQIRDIACYRKTN